MSELRWYRSLYWRIALGLFAFLALMLAAQGALFLWITDRIAGSMPARDPRRLAVMVASDVGAALSADATLDLSQYVRDQYGHVFQTFLVIMQDGRVVSNNDDVPDELVRAMVAEAGRFEPPRGRRFGAPPAREPGTDDARSRPGERVALPEPFSPRRLGEPVAPPREADGAARFGRGGGPRRGEFAAIIANGTFSGRVAVVPGGPPFSRIVRELGPTMGVVGGAVLGVGMALIAFVIFGPARKRLKQVQDAAERLGGGDLAARAPAGGGDEVAAVARSFNRMAEELTARASALEASDKARRQLLADVSHELMTPLTAMRGYVETLSMPELQLDEETARRYLSIVTEETHRLERIIGDLLDLARLEGGGGTWKHDRVDVRALFERVAARHERELRERRISLVQDVAADATETVGDFDRLEQALQNLAANALRHSEHDGRITLEAARLPRDDVSGREQIRLRVRDTGRGIAAEHLPLIFDRFYKVDAARKASGGSGLGLSIVKAIVERHGGRITAYNDDGAVFEIVLPAAAQ
jgi:signal transduction histidine kinase